MADKIMALQVLPGKEPRMIETEQDLKTLQSLVDGSIECVYPWSDYYVALICNEESKILGMPANRGLSQEDLGEKGNKTLYDIICGPFIIAGCAKDGNFRSLKPEEINFFMKRFQFPEMFFRTSDGIKAIPYEPEPEQELE